MAHYMSPKGRKLFDTHTYGVGEVFSVPPKCGIKDDLFPSGAPPFRRKSGAKRGGKFSSERTGLPFSLSLQCDYSNSNKKKALTLTNEKHVLYLNYL